MIEDILKKNNIKITKQRIKVLSFVIEKEEVTIKDILSNIKDIDTSTIYRILSLFEDKKIISKTVNNHEIYYMFNKNDHKHYIECIECHLKVELDECPYHNIDLKGYKIDNDETIKGLCQNCQSKDKIGLFVGSFNPPTKAHLEIGNLLLSKKIIDKLIYVPCNDLEKNNLIDINNRFDMLNLMINDLNMEINDLKVKDNIKSFNYLDLEKLKEKYYNSFYIIIGSDNLVNLSNWDNYQDMLENNYFIVLNRFNSNDLNIIKNKYQKYQDKFIIIDYNNNISSSKVREMIKNNKDLTNVLDNKVISYLKQHNLYK